MREISGEIICAKVVRVGVIISHDLTHGAVVPLVSGERYSWFQRKHFVLQIVYFQL